MGNGLRARQLQEIHEPLHRGDIGCGVLAEKAAQEGEQPELGAGQRALCGIAAETLGVASGHKVAWTGLLRGFEKKLAVGADGLKAVMLENDGLAREETEKERRECGPGEMDDIGGAEQTPELEKVGAANDRKRERAVVVIPCRGLGHQSYGKFGVSRRRAAMRQAAGEGEDDGLNAANARREKMRIDEQLHPEWSREAIRSSSVAAGVAAGDGE